MVHVIRTESTVVWPSIDKIKGLDCSILAAGRHCEVLGHWAKGKRWEVAEIGHNQDHAGEKTDKQATGSWQSSRVFCRK
jgi:hypothetical protein